MLICWQLSIRRKEEGYKYNLKFHNVPFSILIIHSHVKDALGLIKDFVLKIR